MYVAIGCNWLYMIGVNLFQKKIKQERIRETNKIKKTNKKSRCKS